MSENLQVWKQGGTCMRCMTDMRASESQGRHTMGPSSRCRVPTNAKFKLDIRKKFFTVRVVRMVQEQNGSEGCECPILGSILGWVERGLEQPDLWKVSLPRAGGLEELNGLLGTFQAKPFQDSMNL